MNQSQRFKSNTTIFKIERAGQIDRYGKQVFETVFSNIRGRLELRTSFSRTVQGDTLTFDGSLWLDKRYPVKSKDLVTLENTDTYEVSTVDDNMDIQGKPTYYFAFLTKQH